MLGRILRSLPCEVGTTDSSKTGDSVVAEREFERYSWLAMRAAREEQVASTISMFIRDYIGDSIVGDKMPEIRRRQPDGNEYSYDVSLENGFTEEGHLVHIRRSVGSCALERLQTYAHFVVTAEADTGEFTEWRVNDVRHESHGTRLTSEFILTTDKLDVHDGMPEFDSRDNPLDVEIARREIAQQRIERDNVQARLIMSNDGIWFKPRDGTLEVVHNIRELTRDRELIKESMATLREKMAKLREELTKLQEELAKYGPPEIETDYAEELLRNVS